MQPEELLALPVASCAEEDSLLFMWAVWPKLPQAIELMSAWGFTYQTVGFVWVKTYTNPWKPFFGMGFYTRSNTEVVLIGKRGQGRKRKYAGIHQLVEESAQLPEEPAVYRSPILTHSQKPTQVRDNIASLYDGPYLELFARQAPSGWDVWGNQAPTETEPEGMDFDEVLDCTK